MSLIYLRNKSIICVVSRDVEVSEELGKFITESYTASRKFEEDIEKIPIVSTHIFDKKNSRKIMEKFRHSVDDVERAEETDAPDVPILKDDILIFVFHSMIELPKWLLEYANVTMIDRTRE